MRPRYLANLERAAHNLKEGLEERNEASLAVARAKNDIERQAATLRHERAYRQLDELKRAFMEAVRDPVRPSA
jgi:hypothetical protein